VYLEILIEFEKSTELSAVKVWNYNKGPRHATKGVKEAQIFLNDKIIFDGIIRVGKG